MRKLIILPLFLLSFYTQAQFVFDVEDDIDMAYSIEFSQDGEGFVISLYGVSIAFEEDKQKQKWYAYPLENIGMSGLVDLFKGLESPAKLKKFANHYEIYTLDYEQVINIALYLIKQIEK